MEERLDCWQLVASPHGSPGAGASLPFSIPALPPSDWFSQVSSGFFLDLMKPQGLTDVPCLTYPLPSLTSPAPVRPSKCSLHFHL